MEKVDQARNTPPKSVINIGELKYVPFSEDVILHIKICVSFFWLQDVGFMAHGKDTFNKNSLLMS